MYTQTSTDPCLSVLSIKHSSCGKYVKKKQKHPYSKVKHRFTHNFTQSVNK